MMVFMYVFFFSKMFTLIFQKEREASQTSIFAMKQMRSKVFLEDLCIFRNYLSVTTILLLRTDLVRGFCRLGAMLLNLCKSIALVK